MEDNKVRHTFFHLYSSSDPGVREKLEEQFEVLIKKVSQVNRLLIEQRYSIIRSAEDFQLFHNQILDEELRKAFGFTETVVVYLYRMHRLKEKEFGRVYVPNGWSEKKKAFMENAVSDLRRFYLDKDELEREGHLFRAMVGRLLENQYNPAYQSYSTFLEEVRNGVQDEIGPLPISPEAESIFAEEMLIVTPIIQEVERFLVTVNTYISKEHSLIGQVREKQKDKGIDALKKWYVTAHEIIAECFLSVAHALRLQEMTLEYRTLERVSVISHLLSHPSVKLFTTPLKNAADDLRALNINFVNNSIDRDRFNLSLNNIDLITDLWEGNLVVLEEFGAIEGDSKYSLDCQLVGVDEWQKIEKTLREAARVLFFNHINDLYDDPEFQDLYEQIVKERSLSFGDFFRLSVTLRQSPTSYGHSKLIALHLISFLENAIEAADLTGAAESYLLFGKVDEDQKYRISFSGSSDSELCVIEVENDCPIRERERESLIKLGKHAADISSGKTSIGKLRPILEERKYTTKSGTGFGWAIILAADYFSRLTVVKGVSEKRRGSLSIELGATRGVKIRIHLPLPKDGERVIVKSWSEHREDEN